MFIVIRYGIIYPGFSFLREGFAQFKTFLQDYNVYLCGMAAGLKDSALVLYTADCTEWSCTGGGT